MSISENIKNTKSTLPVGVTLVAVSKTRSSKEIQEAYDTGQRIFGENKIQELQWKYPELPKDIEWHAIGHLQRNKVKYIAPYISMIHAVDSLSLLKEIDKRAALNDRKINCLLQLHVAEESTKFGFSIDEIQDLLKSDIIVKLENTNIRGLMCMATFTDDKDQIKREFNVLKTLFDQLKDYNIKGLESFDVLSMGMSGDYNLAIECGSNMVRIGTAIFGLRNYT